MTIAAPSSPVVPARGLRVARLVGRASLAAAAIPAALFGMALLVRLWAGALISFPLTEGSAYYIAVARSLATGRGFVVDTIWSYATPPLTLPRPAFELWQPLASLAAALPMTVMGPSFDAAQAGFAVLGALLGPLAWLVARDAARRLRVPPNRRTVVAIGAGLLAVLCGPLVLSAGLPDSTLVFTTLAVAACLVMPLAATGDRRAVVGLGLLLGLAYLTRLEAIYLGLTFVLLAAWRAGSVGRAVPLVMSVAAVAALCALPWWLRNAAVFGTPLPGQLADNLFLTRNEQIFSYLDRPSLDGFLGQGALVMAANIGAALWHNVVVVLLVPGGFALLIGALTVAVGIGLRRASGGPTDGALSGNSPLMALLISGGMTLASTSLFFPVATLWGTFEHAAGPLVVGLLVAASLGADGFVAWVRRRRDWPRANAWLAPLALVVLTVPLTALQTGSAAVQARTEEALVGAVAGGVAASLEQLGIDNRAPLISDRPVWLSAALHRPVIALPDEEPNSVLLLATDFGAVAVVLVEGRGRYPAALRGAAALDCFHELPIAGPEAPDAALFVINEECTR